MSLDWTQIQKELSPLKDYNDLRQRFGESFAYSFVRQVYNFTLPQAIAYTQSLLGEDARARYTAYTRVLVNAFEQLHRSDVRDLLDLVSRIDSKEKFETFTTQSGVPPQGTIAALKYLVYWVVPMKKLLSGLVQKDPRMDQAIQALRELGIRANLDILQAGLVPSGRLALAAQSGQPAVVINELVNRADFSRMPWASKATISNIIGAGYTSLAALAGADPGQLYQDFFRYGKSIGKNLKFGNEIESSYRIAQIIPVVLQADSPASV